MIQFDKTYDINNGGGSVRFKKLDDDTVEAVYNRGTIMAKWDGDILKGIYDDTHSKGSGIIHFTFIENAFEAKWKSGTEEGPMKGKWNGQLIKSDLDLFLINDSFEEIAEKVDLTIKSIIDQTNIEQAKLFSYQLKKIMENNPQLHWVLLYSRQQISKQIENCEDVSKIDSLIEFSYNFELNDIVEIEEDFVLQVSKDSIDQIDFFFNSNINVWGSTGEETQTFLDALYSRYNFESQILELDQQLATNYIRNLILTFITLNCRNYSRPSLEFDSESFAKIFWTILENSASSCETELYINYFDEDSDYEIVVDPLYFFLERILFFDLENDFNSEIDTDFSNYNGYRTDFIALSEDLLDGDIFDL
jgi:hypothetical protein